MRILIVDDDPTAEEFVHHLKMRFGAECFVAETVEDGLRMRKEILGLDGIVHDLSFHEMSREDVIACLHLYGPIPVFVFTGYDDQTLFTKAMMVSCVVDCFIKGTDGSALAARIGGLVFRKDPDAHADLLNPLLQARREQAAIGREAAAAAANAAAVKQSWFSTSQAVISIGVLLILQLVALGGFIYFQGGANALFRNRVETNTNDIVGLKASRDELHDWGQESKQNRHKIETDIQALSARVSKSDDRFDELRKDMNAGFQRIYDVLLADRKTNSDNRATDQARPR